MEGTRAKITLVFNALVYLRDKNMAQKKHTMQPLIKAHRHSSEKE